MLDQPLADGGEFLVPQDVTVMIDAGAIFKMRKANLNAGTTPQGLCLAGRRRDPGAGHAARGLCSSLRTRDDTIGGDSDGPSAGAARRRLGRHRVSRTIPTASRSACFSTT